MKSKQHTSYHRLVVGIMITLAIGVIAFSGGAAAYQPENVTLTELDGETKYQGQVLNVDVSALNVSGSTDVYFTKINDDDSTDTVDTLNHGGDDFVVVDDTNDLDSGLDYGFTTSSTTSVENISGVFTISKHDFSVEWDEERVTDRDVAAITIESNRVPEYPVSIKADGISYAELSTLFSSATVTEDRSDIPFDELGYDPQSTTVEDVKEDGYVTVKNWDNGNENIDAQFDKLANSEGLPSPGDYEFELTAADTGVSDTTTVEIGSESESASFSKEDYQGDAGDLMEFTVDMKDTDTVFVQVGGKNNGFVDILYVERKKSNSGVTIAANTRLLGTNPSLQTDQVYSASNVKTFTSAYHANGKYPFGGNPTIWDKDVFMDDSPSSGNTSMSYPKYLQAIELASSASREAMLNKPLQPTEYGLYAAGFKNIDASNEAVFQADTSKPTDTLAQATVTLNQPRPHDITIYQAPQAEADDAGGVNKILNDATQTKSVAVGDQVIIGLNATGIYGGIIADPDGGKVGDLEDRNGEVGTEFIRDYIAAVHRVELVFDGTNEVGNQNPPQLNFDARDDITNAYVDRKDDRIYIVVDTSSKKAFTTEPYTDYNPYNVKFVYDGTGATEEYNFENEDPSNGAFSVQSEDVSHPFVQPGESLSTEQQFSISSKKVDFENMRDGVIQLHIDGSSKISGGTNVAPGSSAKILLTSNETAFRKESSVTISEDGSFSKTVDLSDREIGEKMNIQFIVRDNTVASGQAVMTKEIGSGTVDDLSEPEPTNDTKQSGTDEQSSDTGSNDGSQQESTDGSGDGSSDASTSSNDGIPGFGMIVALVSLVLSVVLAMKRT